MNLLHPPRLQALAREHALGTLRGGARRRFERLLHESAAARAELAAWQERFATLAQEVPPMAPREQVWQGLQQRLGMVTTATPKRSWYDPLRWGFALGGTLAGALGAVLLSTALFQANPSWLGHEPSRDGLPPSYVGLLATPSGQPALLLSSRRHGSTLTAKLLQPLAVPEGQVAVLWAMPKEGKPFQVGVLRPESAARSVALPLPETAEKLFFTVDRLGVSLAPASAIPDAPGSDWLWQGPCVKLW